ncbi:MAG: hypothetical protein AAGG68_23005 [Bacteroidota bacterium]
MIKRSTLFSFIILLSFHSFSQSKQKRDIQFYFDNLPDTCFQLCKLKVPSVMSSHRKVLDIRNGFISFKQWPYDDNDPASFQAALFKGSDNKDIIAVSTRSCGDMFACFYLNSFFYIYEDGNWVKADTLLLPEITLKLFYDDSSNSNLLNKYGHFEYHYILPRYGTEIKIELSICDYLTFDNPEVTDEQYDKLIREKKVVYLKWEKSSNQFKIK